MPSTSVRRLQSVEHLLSKVDHWPSWRNNISGVPGVHFKAGQGEHPGYWMAITGARNACSISKAFSIKTHGFDLAKALAVAERARQLAAKSAIPSGDEEFWVPSPQLDPRQ